MSASLPQKKKKKMSASERINALKTRIQRTNTACCLEAQEERRLCMLIFLYLQSLDDSLIGDGSTVSISSLFIAANGGSSAWPPRGRVSLVRFSFQNFTKFSRFFVTSNL
jgi:hypothetical protein